MGPAGLSNRRLFSGDVESGVVLRRFGWSVALAALAVTSLEATSVTAEAAGTLIWGMPAETDTLDPHATGGWGTYQITYQIFEGLVKEDLTKADAPTPPLVPGILGHLRGRSELHVPPA